MTSSSVTKLFSSVNGNTALELFPEHLEDLRKSGLSDQTILEACFRSIDGAACNQALQLCGFDSLDGVDSLLSIPYPGCEDFARLRVFPSLRSIKYLQSKGSDPRIYVPPRSVELAAQSETWILMTEGEKKALKAAQEGLPCFGLGGIWAWRTSGIGDDLEALLPDFDRIPIADRKVALVYDSDITPDHKQGYPAFQRLATALKAKGAAEVRIVTLPALEVKA